MPKKQTKRTQKNTPVSATTFTGKERDEETGYSYFGARYYDSDLSGLFLSVDPMADKYPSISPYAYCAWNPLKLVDPDGRDVYQLNTETGSLTLQKKTKDRYDIIEAGKVSGIGPGKGFKSNTKMKLSKGILSGKENQDISKTGFVTCGNLQEEALNVAVFISFSCHKEISGVGYDGIMGNHDLEVFKWANNTDGKSDNPRVFSPQKGGKSVFHFHTHCGNKKGQYGYAKPSLADQKVANKLRNTSGIDTYVLISRKNGSVLFNENGRISPYVKPLPKSVRLKY